MYLLNDEILKLAVLGSVSIVCTFQVRKWVMHLPWEKKKKIWWYSKHIEFKNVACIACDLLMNRNMWIFIIWEKKKSTEADSAISAYLLFYTEWYMNFIYIYIFSSDSQEILTKFNNSAFQGEIMVTAKWVTTSYLTSVTSLQLISSFTCLPGIWIYLMYTQVL